MDLFTTGVALLVLVAVTFTIVRVLRLDQPWLQPWAMARAALQLGVLSVVLAGAITSFVWVGIFLGIMVAAAIWTVSRRLVLRAAQVPQVLLIIAASAGIPIALLFLTRSIEPSPRYLLAVGGIVVGGAMTAATLMGRALAASIRSSRDVIEGWLALGATPRQAVRSSVREAASTALVPATDQTRTTGLVTLPGAFVGAVFAGASTIDAAQFQLLVLASVLCAGALAVAMSTWFFGAPRTIPLAS